MLSSPARRQARSIAPAPTPRWGGVPNGSSGRSHEVATGEPQMAPFRATIPGYSGGDVAMGEKHGDVLCPRYQRAIDIIGKRWTCLILRVLLTGPRRFGHIEDVVHGLSARML